MSKIPSGIETTTFRLVVQHLSQLSYQVLLTTMVLVLNTLKLEQEILLIAFVILVFIDRFNVISCRIGNLQLH